MGKLIDNYSLQAQLGSGVYSIVYKAINVVTKQQVAIKMIKANKFKELPKLEEGTVNEINTLTTLKSCPNIIQYYDMLKTVNNYYFVYEYCNGGTLEKIIKGKGSLGEKQSLFYFKQLVNAFKVLSQNNIMHRDIKPENILIHNGVLKVADFGFCKPLENEDGMADTMLGSPLYMAPEVLKGQQYTIKADIWSLGVVLYRMVFGFCPFEEKNIGKLILILKEEQLKFPKNHQISSALEELLRKMLIKNAKQRADWNQIFSYTITQNFQICSPYKSIGKDSMKSSTTGSMTSSKCPNFAKEEPSMKKMRSVESPQHSDAKNFQKTTFFAEKQSFRETFDQKQSTKSSMQILKKQVYLKNHKKCIELNQLSLEVASYDSKAALVVSYLISKNVEKQLLLLRESIKKDYTPISNSGMRKIDDSFIEDFNLVLSEEFKSFKTMQQEYVSMLIDMGLDLREVLNNKKGYLKEFILSLENMNFREQCLCHQLLDYIMEDILISKKTYEKLNREQIMKKIREKLRQIN